MRAVAAPGLGATKRGARRTLAAAAVGLALAAAAVAGAAEAAAAAEPSAPTPRDVLRAALQLRDVRLDVDASCRRAGPHEGDRTIGDYLAGMLAEMDRPVNTVEASCEPARPGVHRCTLWLKHRDEEERWAWGLAFEIDRARRPLPRSVRCVGAG